MIFHLQIHYDRTVMPAMTTTTDDDGEGGTTPSTTSMTPVLFSVRFFSVSYSIFFTVPMIIIDYDAASHQL